MDDGTRTRMREIDRAVAKKLRLARCAAGVTQDALAAALAVSPQQLRKYESAKNRVTPGVLAIWAEATGRDVGWFFATPQVVTVFAKRPGVPSEVAAHG